MAGKTAEEKTPPTPVKPAVDEKSAEEIRRLDWEANIEREIAGIKLALDSLEDTIPKKKEKVLADTNPPLHLLNKIISDRAAKVEDKSE